MNRPPDDPIPAADPAADFEDESADSVTDPDVPVADKGDMTRVLNDTGRPANGLSTTPPGGGHDGLPPDVVEDEPPRTGQLDLEDGEMDDEVMTQGESVVDAEYMDRGPAQLDGGVDASGAADVADVEDGDAMTGTRGVRTVEDASIVDTDTSRD